jgi:hypothetical protein
MFLEVSLIPSNQCQSVFSHDYLNFYIKPFYAFSEKLYLSQLITRALLIL